MAAMYALLAVALGVIGYALRPWGLLLVWPAASLAVIAAAYVWLGPHVFHKRGGRLHPITRVGMLPYLLGGWLTFPHYRRTAPPWVELTPRLILGRRLNDAEAREQVARGVAAVLDLTAECEAPPAFRDLAYRNIPILDLTVPTPRQLADAVDFIRAHATDGRKVYLHCKLGRSRSAAVAAAYLIAEGLAKDAHGAVAMVRAARPEIVIGQAAVEALERYAAEVPGTKRQEPNKHQ
jgi:protein phosphatase